MSSFATITNKRLTGFFFSLLLSTNSWAQTQPELVDAWITAAPPGSRNLAGYFIFENKTTNNFKIIKVKSPAFEKVEMHQVSFPNGMMRMTEIEELALPAGQTVAFETGTRHLMLIGPKHALPIGSKVKVDFSLNNGEIINAQLDVRR
ncbi:MAG: copper chaperone PCu(A)C [Gammaproteobacteria bacterium]|nr:copper chaperone PCu(A)C [Gammaproteobacteria bacterium]